MVEISHTVCGLLLIEDHILPYFCNGHCSCTDQLNKSCMVFFFFSFFFFFFFSWTQLYDVSKPVQILFQLNWTWSLCIRGWTSQSAFLSTAPKRVAQLKKIETFIEISMLMIFIFVYPVAKTVEHNNMMSLMKNSIESAVSVELCFCSSFYYSGEQCAQSLCAQLEMLV